MKVVISNGFQEADYIISMYKKNNKVIVINDNKEVCKYLSKKNKIDVVYGNSTKEYDLLVANIDEADLFIALSTNDIDNYVACKMAKLFNVKRCIATVINPKNVEIFKKCGIDYAISSTHLLADVIKNESNVETMIKTLSLEDDKVLIYEVILDKLSILCDKFLKDIKFPAKANICCIYRYPHVIIPNGNTKLIASDKIFIVSSREYKEKIINFIQRRNDEKGN